ncbi:MAG: hypothetical protein Q8S11_02905 [Daejeonella sp.]|uniref:hypothetical protein n=1 Tax=Daejeonella sp. TaxID=2805397 RepID=UPI0027348B51|nr:hypothetical protein [Daejeonella sp.]MDP3467256.1 hypothetical protein [Daejeonella sp.]
MNNETNRLGEVWINVMPDFKIIKPYLFPNMSQGEFNKEVRLYKSVGKVSIPFLTQEKGRSYCSNLEKIINKYELKEHINNLFFIISYTYSNTMQRVNGIERPGRESTERIKEFDTNISALAANINSHFTITFEEKVGNIESDYLLKPIKSRRKPVRFKFTHKETTDWIKNLIVEAIEKGQFPMSLGLQLISSSIIPDGEVKKFVLSAPTESFIKLTEKAIIEGAILSIAIPIINYLQNQTSIKQTSDKYWSYDQLGFVIDVLFLTGLQTRESRLPYKFHSEKPTANEKDALDKMLLRKVNKRKLLFINPIR